MPTPDKVQDALETLRRRFAALTFPHGTLAGELHGDVLYKWPGRADEDIMVCAPVFTKREPFHRHEFFYFNFTMKGSYDSISRTEDSRITINEDELYAGEPAAPHALMPTGDAAENVIIGVLIARRAFVKDFLPLLTPNTGLFRFFLEPDIISLRPKGLLNNHDTRADRFLHFRLPDSSTVRELLGIMAAEYAHPKADTQAVLKPLALSYLVQIERQLSLAAAGGRAEPPSARGRLIDDIVRYIEEHIADVTLKDTAAHFSRHPVYISSLVHREMGATFSDIVQDMRMKRARALLCMKDLSIEEIAYLTGYGSASSFYRAYRARYGQTPREGGA